MCMNASIYTKSRFYGMSIGVNLIGKGIGPTIAVYLLIYMPSSWAVIYYYYFVR